MLFLRWQFDAILVPFFLVFVGTLSIAADEVSDLEFFEKNIRPVLVRHCYECHASSSSEAKGNFTLDSREGIRRGGETGPGVVPGDAEKSLVIAALRHESIAMPPETQLPRKVIADFVAWVEMGAPDPRSQPPTAAQLASATWDAKYHERRQWWSLQPVTTPSIPNVQNASWSDRAIDRFILAELEKHGLAPAPQANRETLLRRLTFNLTGLAPTLSMMHSFVNDDREGAWEHVIDLTLDSPHFGERWARHWMDVVRYTDTYGYEWDVPAKGAWRYRDYLIRAFNADVPFDQLVREHIAGDLLEEPRLHVVERINESLIGPMFFQMGEKRHGDSADFNGVHQEMLDNKIDAFSKAFQATTISCARCHDHMLDAVAQREYYALAGVFASSRWVTNTLDLEDRNQALLTQLSQIKKQLREQCSKLWRQDAQTAATEIPKATFGGEESSAWNAVLKTHQEQKELPWEDTFRPWIEIVKAKDSGQSIAGAWSALAQRYAAEQEKRRIENANHFKTIVDFREGIPTGWSTDGTGIQIVPCGDFLVAVNGPNAIQNLLIGGLQTNALSSRLNGALRSPLLKTLGRSHISYQYSGGGHAAARDVYENAFLTERFNYLDSSRPTWLIRSTVLGPPDSNVFQEFVTKTTNPNFPPRVGLGGDLTVEQISNPRSWFGITKVIVHQAPFPPQDGLLRFHGLFKIPTTPDGSVALRECTSLEEIAQAYADWFTSAIDRWEHNVATEEDVHLINTLLKSELLTNDFQHPQLTTFIKRYREIEKQIKPPWTVNGLADLDPGQDYRLNIRGNYDDLGDPIPRGYLQAIMGSSSAFKSETSGRKELAAWIASPENPLTARVFVNRVWHWLFGTGLVATPNDFGHLGDQPSHPELLDHLTRQFIDDGWSLKKLIRSIVVSKAWQQSGHTTNAALQLDARNRWLHHYPLRRLEAEAIRDAILSASGRLDRQLFGQPIDPPRQKEDEYKRLFSGPLDGLGRRSIYTKVTIMEPPRFLATFNQPKPKIPTGRRDSTSTTAQSLTMMNDPFVRSQAEFWARTLVGTDHASTEERIAHMFQVVFSRSANVREITRWNVALEDLSAEQDTDDAPPLLNEMLWTAVAHAMFNAKEFIYIQ